MKMKNILWYFITAVVLTTVVCIGATAAGSITVDVPEYEVPYDSMTTIPVTIHEPDNIAGFQIDVLNTVKGVDIKINNSKNYKPLDGSYTINNNNDGGLVPRIVWYDSYGFSEESPIFYLDITPLESTPTTSAWINLSITTVAKIIEGQSEPETVTDLYPAVNGHLKIKKAPVFVKEVVIETPTADTTLPYKATGTATAKVFDQYGDEMADQVVAWYSNSESLTINSGTGAYEVVNCAAASATITAYVNGVSYEINDSVTVNLEKATLTNNDFSVLPDTSWEYEFGQEIITVTITLNEGIVGAGVPVVTYAGSQTVPETKGNYDVDVTFPEGNNYKAAEFCLGQLVISGKFIDLPILEVNTFTYNGEEQAALVLESEFSDYYTVSGNKETNAGSYNVTFSLIDKENTVWKGLGVSDDFRLEWTINPKAFGEDNSVSIEYNEVEYTGEVFEPTVIAFEEQVPLWTNDYEVIGDTASATVGVHTVKVIGKNNYTGEMTKTWEITQATPTVADLSVSPQLPVSYEFDTEAHAITVEPAEGVFGLGTEFTITYTNEAGIVSNEAPSAKGVYKVNVSINEGVNYTAVSDLYLGDLTITGTLIDEPVVIGEYVYNGLEQTVQITVDERNYSIVGGTQTAIAKGTYSVEVELKDKENTAWRGEGHGTDNLSLEWTINPKSIAGVVVNFTTSPYDYTGGVIIPTLALEDGELVLDENDYILREDLGNATAGVYTETFTGQNNYTGTVTGIWEIKPIAPTLDDLAVPTESVEVEYDGTSQKDAVVITAKEDIYGIGEEIKPIYIDADGKVVAEPTLPGAYQINISVSAGVNYTAAEIPTELLLIIENIPPVDPKMPTPSIDENGNVTIPVGGSGAILSEDGLTAIIQNAGVNVTITFKEVQTNPTNLNGNVTKVVADYLETLATAAAGVNGIVNYSMSLDLGAKYTNLLPTISTAIDSGAEAAAKAANPNFALAAMINATANAEAINNNLTENGITIYFTVPKAWFNTMRSGVKAFHWDGTSFELVKCEVVGSDDADVVKLKVTGSKFSSYGIVGDNTAPYVPSSGGGGGSSGSSTWATATPTPAQPTPTPTDAQPTDAQPTETAPTVQPTSAQPTKPAGSPAPIAGLILGGLAAAAVLRRK